MKTGRSADVVADDIRVRVVGDPAVVTYQLQTTVLSDGVSSVDHERESISFSRVGGQWLACRARKPDSHRLAVPYHPPPRSTRSSTRSRRVVQLSGIFSDTEAEVLVLRHELAVLRRQINGADPSPTSHTLTLGEVNHEYTVCLVGVEDEDEFAEWLARHHETLFEEELNGWYSDPALWPRDRSIKMLDEWCSFELHTVVADTGASPLEDQSRKNE